jgi:carotenoid 1,2-hydratase
MSDVMQPAPQVSAARQWAFDRPVARRGYCWWYLDALSDDGRHGITIIAFIGTVFSPWYALARRAEGGTGGDPHDHCCLNVVLYGTPARWAMTDRRRHALRRDADSLTIGPSGLHWDGTTLTVRIEEVTAPIPSRLRGIVRLRPTALSTRRFTLDSHGRHEWQPIAPRSRVEVELESPALRWSGAAYFDTNAGTAPLEQDFRSWDWCRAALPDATAILYNAQRRDGTDISLALKATDDGALTDFAPPPPAEMPRTLWRLRRPTRAEGAARVVRTLTDAPFYSRSEIHTRLLGQDAPAVHESLSLDRFRSPLMYAMLPWRVPRPLK